MSCLFSHIRLGMLPSWWTAVHEVTSVASRRVGPWVGGGRHGAGSGRGPRSWRYPFQPTKSWRTQHWTDPHGAVLALAGCALAVRNVDDVDNEEEDGDSSEEDSFCIPERVMRAHINDLDYIDYLTKSTLTCDQCWKRRVIDGHVDGVDYCQCCCKTASVYGQRVSDIAWTPFLERKDILVWRHEHPDKKGHYAYKMYGRFDDVTAQEFLEVQLDTSAFRLSWDKSTAQCYVIEESVEEASSALPVTNRSQIYYWEVNWPKFFANRDYVCGRTAKWYKKDNVIVVYSKSMEHKSCPCKSKNYRVTDYWSVLTIRPFHDVNTEGLEFSLTAFENPGLSLPSSITTWVAIRAMPDFMLNLRKACHELRIWKTSVSKGKQNVCLSNEPTYLQTPSPLRPQQLT